MPKIIGGSLSEHREQTRNKLFAALATLMSERGFDSVTLAEIAAAAGVGRTAVYNHVPDKETLLLEFITHETDQWVAALRRALDGVADPVLQLRAYIRQQAELKRVFHLAPGGAELRSLLSPEMQRRLREHAVPVETILRGILTAGMEAGAFARQPLETTVPLVHACLSSRSLPEEDGPGWAQAVAATEAFVLRAVGADVTTPTATQPVAAPVPEVAAG